MARTPYICPLSCNAILEKIPTIECFNIEYDDIINDPDDLNENEEKIECKLPELSEKDKSALLVADLCENKRISLDLSNYFTSIILPIIPVTHTLKSKIR